MKLKEGFVLTKVGDNYVAVQVGDAPDKLHGLIRLNETGAFIWRGLEEGLDEALIAERMVAEYAGVDLELAKKAVNDIVGKLANDGLLE